jgi:signal transduction histidine kinase
MLPQLKTPIKLALMTHTLLCIDDEKDNVEALHRHFRKKYNVLTATSGKEALEILRRQPVHLIISDQRMPHMSGVEFLKASQKIQADAVRILLTGYTDIESVISAINDGHVYRYVTKPWDSNDLSTAVAQALDYYDLHAQLAEKNKALREALEDLKTLDEAKSHFMILINHELKTPLTSMISFLALLKESKLDDEQKLFMRRIYEGTERLQKLIDDTLLLVSAETGQLRLQNKKHKLSALIPDFSVTQEELIRKKNLKMELNLPPAKVNCDIKIIQEVLERLLDNAIRFAKEKTTVSLTAAETEGQWRLILTNAGPDLSENLLRRIRKPFTLNEDIMKHSRGLGMGLSLSQALLKFHGSLLELESQKGQVKVSFVL